MSAEASTQTFSFETMAVVLYAMQESGVTLGMKHYEMMAAISGKGKDSFNHQFRKVKARAKELGEQAKNGDLPSAPATPSNKANGKGKNGTPATGASTGGKKRGRKAKDEAAVADAEDEESPTKKVKKEGSAEGDDGDALS